jgi:hypothetical protein
VQLPGEIVLSKANCYHVLVVRITIVFLCLLIPVWALARNTPVAHLSTFEAGNGPSHIDGIYHLLDGTGMPGQSNAIAFDLAQEGTFEQVMLRCRLRVLAGGDGGAFAFLNTSEYGRFGPAPFIKSWVEPNLTKTFAVGIDVHNPTNDERFGPWGNYQGLPEREVSLHWDGREIVKRVAPVEFRGDFTECEIFIQYMTGGAEVTIKLAGEVVFDGYFVAGMLPYESRLAIGTGTRDDATTEFDVQDITFRMKEPAQPQRDPKHIEVFNHVLTSNVKTSYEKEVSLPPLNWAYGRVILTLEIHDAGPDWDKWDRNGFLFLVGPDGAKHDIAPFITSFRTPGHWQADITHFRPWLTGKVTFEIATTSALEKNRGYMLSAALNFYHGTPDLEPYRVVPLWSGTAKYKSAQNHFSDFFTPQTVSFDASTKAARLFMTTTGHSQVGEFTPSRRTVIFAPEKGGAPATEQHFSNTLWKSDCYLNPVRPQHGTWKLARAGWAPGDIVRPWWIDLTPYILPGKTAELRYESEPYDFSGVPEEQRPTDEEVNSAVQLVRTYLILYRSPAVLLSAPTIEVLEIEAGSNAERGGIEAGDYLESYDGQRPDTIDELLEMIRDAEAAGKQSIQVDVYRGANRLQLELTPGRMGVRIAEEVLH